MKVIVFFFEHVITESYLLPMALSQHTKSKVIQAKTGETPYRKLSFV